MSVPPACTGSRAGLPEFSYMYRGRILDNRRQVSGFGCQVSVPTPVAEAASLIKKETLKSEDQNTTKIGMDSHL